MIYLKIDQPEIDPEFENKQLRWQYEKMEINMAAIRYKQGEKLNQEKKINNDKK